jgi:uncharacterized membrane protein
MLDQLPEQARLFLGSFIPAAAAQPSHPLVSGLSGFAMIAAATIGYLGVAIMVYGAFRAAFDFIRSLIRRNNHLSRLRIELGKHLALGLEFLVGKDIIESIVEPTWNDLGKLGAIIILRTVITIFLTKELKEVEEEIKVEREEVKVEREEIALKNIQEK